MPHWTRLSYYIVLSHWHYLRHVTRRETNRYTYYYYYYNIRAQISRNFVTSAKKKKKKLLVADDILSRNIIFFSPCLQRLTTIIITHKNLILQYCIQGNPRNIVLRNSQESHTHFPCRFKRSRITLYNITYTKTEFVREYYIRIIIISNILIYDLRLLANT